MTWSRGDEGELKEKQPKEIEQSNMTSRTYRKKEEILVQHKLTGESRIHVL